MKKRIFRGLLCLGVIFAVVCIFSNDAWVAENKYPSKTIEMLISFPPGGVVDLQTRLLAKHFEKELGVTVVPVNKPGGGGSLGAGIMASRSPDGHTMSIMIQSSIIMPVLLKQADFSIQDFRAIGRVADTAPVVFVVHPDSPWKTFQDFVEYAKKNPGVKCGHPPTTTAAALKMNYVNKLADLKLVGVPFKTDPDLNVAIMGKHIPIAMSGVATLKGVLEAGKVRVLFSFSPPAEIVALNVDPTTPDFQSFFGRAPQFDLPFYLWVHSKTPNAIIEMLKRTLEKVVKDPEFVRDMGKIGYRAHYVDGDVAMEEMPNTTEFVKDILKELQMFK